MPLFKSQFSRVYWILLEEQPAPLEGATSQAPLKRALDTHQNGYWHLSIDGLGFDRRA